ncbi:MAG: hypothetical protein WCB68_02770 [Pyrinomonadaceae bacterium]
MMFRLVSFLGVLMGCMFLGFAVIQYLNGGWSFLLSLLLGIFNLYVGITLLNRSGRSGKQ